MTRFRVVAGEAVLVLLGATAVALVANAVSPHGLRLSRNYFPRVAAAEPASGRPLASTTEQARPAEKAPAVTSADAVLPRLERHGLRAARSEEVEAWFRDPQFAQGLIIFVDARDDAHFRAGHIPGAWQFNHYRPEEHLPAVLPACLMALKVVVYCGGGDCEDSEFAAVTLRDAGVPRENLFVYVGGIKEWTARNLPVEIGLRGSGQLRPPPP